MASDQIRFHPPPPPPPQPPTNHHHQQQLRPSRKRWGGCWGGLSCFGKQKGGKRIVPASRMPEANSSANQANGGSHQGSAGLNNHTTTALGPSLLAPPSSPASFSNSALQSTAQSPSCFLSANSPGGPSSSMFATGPYAHEMQLVSPPVFSTFTTEPSTAPLTPPPELAHLTTPSSPDVPYAQFLSSSNGKTNNYHYNDLQATYSLYPGSPAKSPQDSNFFCPATFAQFYLDPSSFSQSGGRLSVSRESDAGNVHQNRQSSSNKPLKQDVEEIEAYRASFGFSADEIVTTTQYVEISDGLEESFTITPFTSNKQHEENILDDVQNSENVQKLLPKVRVSSQGVEEKQQKGNNYALSDDDDIFSKMTSSRMSRKYHQLGSSNSDAEVEYRRRRSLRERKGEFAWHD